jgi:hypothetical protein
MAVCALVAPDPAEEGKLCWQVVDFKAISAS